MSAPVTIKCRVTGAAMFECELGVEFDGASGVARLGAAVKLALRAGANLAGANLEGADLEGANLARADLARANLAGAYLAGANLARANLVGAYLARADLARANLEGANLAGAYLAGADLARANLARAYLEGANLASADLADGGQERRGYRFWAWRHKDGHVVYRAGCHEWSSLEKALAHFGPDYNSAGNAAECVARLRLLELCAKARGWITEERT